MEICLYNGTRKPSTKFFHIKNWLRCQEREEEMKFSYLLRNLHVELILVPFPCPNQNSVPVRLLQSIFQQVIVLPEFN